MALDPSKDLTVGIGLDSKEFNDGISELIGNFGEFGKLLTNPVVGAVALGTLAAKMAFEMAGAFESASESIGKATGATGENLTKLNEDLQAALSGGFEQSTADAAAAIGILNTRLGLTGEELSETTVLLGSFADVTGQDVATSTREVSKLMARWGVDMEDLPLLLDQLALAGQKSDISVGYLTKTLSDSAPILKQFGMTIEEGAALFSTFELAGVRSEVVVRGMNTAIAKFVEDGIDPATGFPALIEEIQNAESSTDATALAVEYFGQRAGTELVSAIRSGNFEIDNMTKALETAEGTVKKTDEATKTLADAWDTAWNAMAADTGLNLQVIVDVLSHVFTFIAQFVGSTFKLFANFQDAIAAIGGVFIGLGEIIVAIFQGDWNKVWQSALKVFSNFVHFIIEGAEFLMRGLAGPIGMIAEALGLDLDWAFDQALDAFDGWMKQLGYVTDGAEAAAASGGKLGKKFDDAAETLKGFKATAALVPPVLSVVAETSEKVGEEVKDTEETVEDLGETTEETTEVLEGWAKAAKHGEENVESLGKKTDETVSKVRAMSHEAAAATTETRRMSDSLAETTTQMQTTSTATEELSEDIDESIYKISDMKSAFEGINRLSFDTIETRIEKLGNDIFDSVMKALEPTQLLTDTFYALGESMAKGEDVGASFAKIFGEIAVEIIKNIGWLLIQAGLQMMLNPATFWPGLGLVALGATASISAGAIAGVLANMGSTSSGGGGVASPEDETTPGSHIGGSIIPIGGGTGTGDTGGKPPNFEVGEGSYTSSKGVNVTVVSPAATADEIALTFKSTMRELAFEGAI